MRAEQRRIATIAAAVLWMAAWSMLVAQTCPPPQPVGCGTAVYSRYEGRVANDTGGAVNGATISVFPTDNPSVLATLYSDAAGTAKANPFTTDSAGRYSFFVQSGSYNIKVASTFVNQTLVNVGIVDPRKAHVTGGANDRPAVTLTESSAVTANGNASMVLERLKADGTRLAGPWSLHVNKGPAGAKPEFRWLYNVSWEESPQAASKRAVADVAYDLRVTPRGALQTSGVQPYSVSFDYAPTGAALTLPTWTTIFTSQEGTNIPPLTPNENSIRVAGAPFVIGDGLDVAPAPSSPLVARRIGWCFFHTTAPAGIFDYLDGPVSLSCGSPVSCNPCQGDVVVPVHNADNSTGAVRTTLAAQKDASVYVFAGNGLQGAALDVGKALVRVATGSTISPGDVVVSSAAQAGRATVDNTITDPRRIIGYALDSANVTLSGYVAILRPNR